MICTTEAILARFHDWMEQAKACPAIAEPTAMSLATASADGAPSVRMVLLKEADAQGFYFYTNNESRKGRELFANPRAALCLYWMPLGRQVRIEGTVSRVSEARADAYFSSRPRLSRLGAWASSQSRVAESRDELVARLKEMEARFEGKDVPRPPYWGGWCVKPFRVEFWQEGQWRLHEREVFERKEEGWTRAILYP